jgi:hypothetical protein
VDKRLRQRVHQDSHQRIDTGDIGEFLSAKQRQDQSNLFDLSGTVFLEEMGLRWSE